MPIFAIILYYLQLTGDEGLPTQSLERVSMGRPNRSYHRMNIIIISDKGDFLETLPGRAHTGYVIDDGEPFRF